MASAFMGTTNSSKETRQRAKELAGAIGAYHTDLNIDSVVTALTSLFKYVTGFMPRFKVHGGTGAENLGKHISVFVPKLDLKLSFGTCFRNSYFANMLQKCFIP